MSSWMSRSKVINHWDYKKAVPETIRTCFVFLYGAEGAGLQDVTGSALIHHRGG